MKKSVYPSVYVYYHKDFDGVISAALVSFFIKLLNYEPKIVKPLDYYSKLTKTFKEPFALVDFIYYGNPFIYFDHHSSHSKKIEISSKTKYFYLNKKAKSCASVIFKVLNELKEKQNINKFNKEIIDFKNIVKWCNIIDSAAYPENKISVEEILNPKEPAIILSKALEITQFTPTKTTFTKFWNSIVENLILNHSLEECIKDKEVQKYYKLALENQEKAIKELKEKSYNYEGIVVYDVEKWARYVLAHLYPDSLIWLGIRKNNSGFILHCGKNPWNIKNKNLRINIGDIMKEYKGGGHQFVGAAFFSSHEEAKEALEKILEKIKAELSC